MTLEDLVRDRAWDEIEVSIGDEMISFVVFPWSEVREREEDGAQNVWEYFVGWDGEVHEKVERGDYVPLAAGGMDAGALRYDGGFQEMGHRGMLFADVSGSGASPSVVYFDLNAAGAPVVVARALDELLR